MEKTAAEIFMITKVSNTALIARAGEQDGRTRSTEDRTRLVIILTHNLSIVGLPSQKIMVRTGMVG